MKTRIGRWWLRLRGYEIYRKDTEIGGYVMTVWAKLRIDGLTYEDRQAIRQAWLLDKGYSRVYN